MKFIFDRDTWQEIFGSIRKNKLRTIITVIGVLWGIFIYIALSGAAKGMDNGFEKAFKFSAINSLFVWPQRTGKPYAGFRSRRKIQFKIQDGETLKKKVPSIEFLAPRSVKGRFSRGVLPKVTRNLKAENYTVFGDFPLVTKISIKEVYDGGRFLNEQDIQYERKICVIGEKVVSDLFEKEEDPIGKFIQIDKIHFQVVGVYKTREMGGGLEGDSSIHIPFSTYKKLYNTGDDIGWFNIAAYDDADVVETEKKVKAVLRQIHQIHPEDERAIGAFNLGEAFGKVRGFSDGISFLSLVVGIATILAGVIGIGNILLISVKERTKEIGVRRALGATPREIKGQIILESVFLTLVAGIVGIIMGALVLKMLDTAFGYKDDFPFVNPTVPLPLVLASLLIMILLGTLIGMIPAQRAVSIKPIDALREE